MAYDSMYLVIEANNLPEAKNVLRKAILDMALLEDNYKYLIGENKIVFANGKVIKNNTVLSDLGNGTYIFEVDREIVAQLEPLIIGEVAKNPKSHWCTKAMVQAYLPNEVL